MRSSELEKRFKAKVGESAVFASLVAILRDLADSVTDSLVEVEQAKPNLLVLNAN
jgi:hypothetical protein